VSSNVQTDTARGDVVLTVEDLRTWFWTPRGVVRAVDGVSLSIERGRTLGVVGESGSGKSVLARSLMNLLPKSAAQPTGRVLFHGRDIRALSRKQLLDVWGNDISMVFQDPMTSLNPVVRIGRQITEALRNHLDMGKDEANARAVELLASVGMPEPAKRLRAYPHELSGGMRQRVSIAIALACNPKLLIADEPTTALDVTIQRQILDLLDKLQDEHHMAMILISHDLGVVAGRADDVAVMYAGKIVEYGPVRKLFHETRHPYTAALLGSIPRMENPSHSRLTIIPGRPTSVIDPVGCRFAPRCRYAQPRCLEEEPELTEVEGRSYRCFYPVGTPEGDEALAKNMEAGHTATGLTINGVAA
jgi:peptide/nickel transport system ATP-binding protein